ncbi:hypothetical protein C9F11_44180 (plasmid) [Streptomyces sp. YIM 121038]|nr:hypothetical protein C9F11_44180 [Streptomyces sp. YIM 121038]
MRSVATLVAGRGREDVAAVFGVSLKAVDKWWAKWQVDGRGTLVMRPYLLSHGPVVRDNGGVRQ